MSESGETDAAEEARRKVIRAIKAGRVGFAPGFAEAIGRMDPAAPDFTVVATSLSCWGKWERNDGGLEVAWQAKSAGCGRVTVYLKDGRAYCESEGMGREFVASVFRHLIDHLEIVE